ncbi:hypothetical protein DQ04_10741010 [Trypanosoma grayi]|uniref:hypothetical protein n=1 Tax=Trypanosoma grayi TaxID=71804 RepID=UPI0004F44AF7|nr:hypothetical protein DQ04_10741010 [Trypanosoma grayi]KEG07147.1 hypothetical protein DQ04_10741010 [Trypanosoma grayi]
MRKKGKKTMASAAAAAPVEDSAEAPAAAVSTPRTMERASVLQRAAEQEGKRASVTAALPSGVDTDGQYVEKDGTQEKNNNNDGAGVARQAARKKRGTRVERRVDVDAGGGTRSDAVNVRRFKRALVL